MNFLQRQLTLVLQGSLDQPTLSKVTENLGLQLRGTTTDPVGTELGRRTEQHPKYDTITAMVLALTRTSPDEWTLTLDVVPGTDSAKWQGLAELGCRAAGLTIINRRLRPIEPPLAETAQVPSLQVSVPSQSAQTVEATAPGLEDSVIPTDPSIYSIPDPAPLRTTPRTDERRRADALLDRVWPDGLPAISSVDQLPHYLDITSITEYRKSNPPKPFPDPPVRTGWPALDDDEIVDLAQRLRRLAWSWRMDDTLGLSSTFGWSTKRVEADRLTIDTRLGTADGYVLGQGSRADCLDLPVTGPAPDDEAGHTLLLDAFARMGVALTDALGEPTERISEGVPRGRWETENAVLFLTYEPPYVHLLVMEPTAYRTQ